jgi:hypothetical protein
MAGGKPVLDDVEAMEKGLESGSAFRIPQFNPFAGRVAPITLKRAVEPANHAHDANDEEVANTAIVTAKVTVRKWRCAAQFPGLVS